MKENSNPTIYSVRNKRRNYTKDNDLIGTSSVQRFHLSHNLFDPVSISSAEERSTFIALSSIAQGDGETDSLGLLDQFGVSFHAEDKKSQELLSQYQFRPSSSSIQGLAKSEEKRIKRDGFEAAEVFDIIRNIQDPEHPLTLEQLNVVNLDHVVVLDTLASTESTTEVDGEGPILSTVDVRFTPTIPHCSMATLIGLCIRVKLLRSLPPRFKVTVRINPGTHASEMAINKQLADKERVRAALENVHLLGVVNKCISNGMKGASD